MCILLCVGPFFDSIRAFRGHYLLQTSFEVRSNLRFKISDLAFLLIHVHIDYMFWAYFSPWEVTTEVKSDLRFEISDLD